VTGRGGFSDNCQRGQVSCSAKGDAPKDADWNVGAEDCDLSAMVRYLADTGNWRPLSPHRVTIYQKALQCARTKAGFGSVWTSDVLVRLDRDEGMLMVIPSMQEVLGAIAALRNTRRRGYERSRKKEALPHGLIQLVRVGVK
jgi:hypothetical protein